MARLGPVLEDALHKGALWEVNGCLYTYRRMGKGPSQLAYNEWPGYQASEGKNTRLKETLHDYMRGPGLPALLTSLHYTTLVPT